MIAGRYSLDHEVGRGGMGAVWLGHDRVLDRTVALKRIGRLPGADSTDLDRAEREARVGAGLSHPNVVAVLDLVVDGDDHWLVMEYVDGSTLTAYVRDRGRLSPDEAAPLLRQVADALVAAHAAGITHRDVKPPNVLIGSNGTAKLSDFGIARRAEDATLTGTGLMLGSPTYLAPEVAGGSRGEAAADVWSFGATMFFALTGRPPYEPGDNVLGTLYRIVHEDPPGPPPEAGWLAPVVAGTLRKDPQQRWPMTRVREALAGGGKSAVAMPAAPVAVEEASEATAPLGPAATPAAERSGRPSGRTVLLGAVGLLVLAAAIGLGLYAAGRGPSPASQARPPATSTSPTPSSTPSSTPTRSPSKKPSAHRKRPAATVAGMEGFIRDYVATLSTDPREAWRMLTPGFQADSGGLRRYLHFWGPARNGRVLDVTADPHAMQVSYQVHFDHFHNGPGPTVLELVHRHDRYLIAAEHTKGFVPAR